MIDKIKEFYSQNKIDIDIINTINGLQITSYYGKINDYKTTTLNKILKSSQSLCLYLQVNNVNIKQDNISGSIVFEIPKENRSILTFNELQKDYIKKDSGLYVNIGKDTKNNTFNYNICSFPHLLIAGTTGSGKSVLINSILSSLFLNYTPSELQAILIDIKQVEFSIYEDIPHLMYKPIKTLEKTQKVLKQVVNQIQLRYEILEEVHCRNIEDYNNKYSEKIPYKLIVIDELAELLMLENKSKLRSAIVGGERLETTICRIAQIGRAAGVHLIVATQRPSSDVITGLLKSNIPSRIALSVASATNSKIIIDSNGAENLTGKGDLLIKTIGNNDPVRLQGAFISSEEQEEIIKKIKNKYNTSNNVINEEKQEKKQEVDINILSNLRYYINRLYQKCNYNTTHNYLYNANNKQEVCYDICKNKQEYDILMNNYYKTLKEVDSEYKAYTPKIQKTIQRSTPQRNNKIKHKGAIIGGFALYETGKTISSWIKTATK